MTGPAGRACPDQGVPGSAGGEGFAQSGSVAVGAGQAVVDVDALVVNAEFNQSDALSGEILVLGRDPGDPVYPSWAQVAI